MALFVGVPISALPPAGTLTGTELFVVDQGSVTSQLSLNDISAFIGSGGLSFTNGLTSAAGVAKFGGALTGNTLISGAFAMQFIGNTGFDVESDSIILQDISNNQSISVTNNGPRIHSSGMAELSFDVGMQQALFTDNRSITAGIEYSADYSAGYTNRSLIDKSYLANQTNKIKLTGKPFFHGDSMTAGSAATGSPGSNSFPQILSYSNYPDHSALNITNLGFGGSGGMRAALSAFVNMPVMDNLNSSVIMIGFNDVVRAGNNPKTMLKIKNSYRSIIANTFLRYGVPASTATATGTWSVNSDFVGKAVNLSGTMMQSSTINDTLVYTKSGGYTGDTLVIGTVATDGISSDYGRFEIFCDGQSLGIYDPNGQSDGISDTVFNNQVVPNVIIIKRIWSVLTIKILDAKPTVIDYIGGLKAPNNCAGVISATTPFASGTGYAPSGSDAAIEAAGIAIRECVLEFQEMAYPVSLSDTNAFYNLATGLSGDFTHPNATGHRQIATSMLSILLPSSNICGPFLDQVGDINTIFVQTDMSKAVNSRKFCFTNENNTWIFAALNDNVDSRVINLVMNRIGNVGIGTSTISAALSLKAGTAAYAQINLPISTAPTSPNDGDLWFDSNTTSGLKMRINGATQSFSFGSSTPTLTATQIGYGDGSNLLTGASTMTFDTSGVNFGNAARTNQRYLRIGQGTSFVDIGEYTSGSYGAIYFNQSTPNNSNYAFLGNASTTQFNATSTVAFNISDISKVTLTNSLFTLLGVDLQLANAFVPGPPSNLTVGYVTMKDSGGNSVQVVCWK